MGSPSSNKKNITTFSDCTLRILIFLAVNGSGQASARQIAAELVDC